MDITIKRAYYDDCTLGKVSLPKIGVNCFSLELPWKNNANDVSCIKEGVYTAVKRISPSNGRVFELQGVEGRSYIQIHIGNFTKDILGCIVLGDSIKFLDGDSIPDVTNSAKTFNAIYDQLPDTITIEIT